MGSKVQLSATPKDSAGNTLTGRTITWSSNAPAVATVSASGLVSAVALGSASVTATSEGKSGTATITVTIVPVASVTITPASASLLVGATQQLSAVTKDSAGNVLSGRVVTWSSNAVGTAGVSSSGLVSAVAAGLATVTAASEGLGFACAAKLAEAGCAIAICGRHEETLAAARQKLEKNGAKNVFAVKANIANLGSVEQLVATRPAAEVVTTMVPPPPWF